MAIYTIIGIGIACALVLYFAFQWDKKEHFLLQLLASFFFVSLLLLIPKAALDNQNNCNIVIANETISFNTTSYDYKYFCEENISNTETTFFKIIVYFQRIFYGYIILYFMYVAFIRQKIIDYKIFRKKKKRK